MLQPAHDAGIRPADLIKLLRISRVTASLWLNGHSRPHQFIEQDVSRLMDCLRKALDAGDLPTREKMTSPERAAYIKRVLALQGWKA